MKLKIKYARQYKIKFSYLTYYKSILSKHIPRKMTTNFFLKKEYLVILKRNKFNDQY